MKTTANLCLMLLFYSSTAAADQVFLDDVIVEGSTCIGLDCSNNVDFDYSTIMLMENNLRILFRDTSNSSMFPSNDWQITINDSNNARGNFFAIEDITADQIPFRVMAGAPENSVIISEYGNLGLGTADPYQLLHLYSNDTPGIRLEQSALAGWEPYGWDILGNEGGMYIQDLITGNIVWQVHAAAPHQSFLITEKGQVGIGTHTPQSFFHIIQPDTYVADGTSMSVLQVENHMTVAKTN